MRAHLIARAYAVLALREIAVECARVNALVDRVWPISTDTMHGRNSP